MTDTIAPPDQYVAGESLPQEFTIEENGSPKDISGATISWYLLPAKGADAADAELDHTDSGVSVRIVDAAAGRVDVTIDQDVTDGLGGRRLWQRLVVDDIGPGKQIKRGHFQVTYP